MKNASLTRIKAIFMKECKHVLRDPFTLMLAVVLPFVQVLILGDSVEFNLRDIKTAVVDQSRSYESKELLRTMNSSGYFKTFAAPSPEEAMRMIKNGQAKAAVVIPPDFDEDLSSGRNADVQVLLDGTDNSSVSAVQGYLARVSEMATQNLLKTKTAPSVLKIRLLFNPELNSQNFIMPALAVLILSLVAILMTALTICREWELGSMELLLSTPVRPIEILIGKIGPYTVLSGVAFMIIYLATRFIFNVPFIGSHWILFLAGLLCTIDYLGIGLFVSVISKQQQVAVQYVSLIGMLPASMLSGFIFPIEYMPEIMQWVTMIFPARWYVEIARGEFLKDMAFTDLWIPFAAMAVQGVVILAFTLSKFKRNLE